MSLTFNLIVALFLLAPGLGVFAGVYAGGKRPFPPSPAEPGSVHALGLVAVGALVCHAAFAWVFVGMDAWCDSGMACVVVGFEPNPYAIILELRDASALGEGSHPGPMLAWLFSALLLAAGLGLVVGLFGFALLSQVGPFRDTLYGWTGELVTKATTAAHVVTAYVVTDTEIGQMLLGYQGALVDLRQAPDGQIRSVVLSDAHPFVVQVSETSAERQPSPRRITIPLLVIEGDHIKNIAFRVILDPSKLNPNQRARMEKTGELPSGEDEDVEPTAAVRESPTPRRTTPSRRPTGDKPAEAGSKK